MAGGRQPTAPIVRGGASAFAALNTTSNAIKRVAAIWRRQRDALKSTLTLLTCQAPAQRELSAPQAD